MTFLTAYLINKTVNVDNVFNFLDNLQHAAVSYMLFLAAEVGTC